MPETTLNKIADLARSEGDIDVIWLYGSRAKGTADKLSDYDIALAFTQGATKSEYRCDELAYQWSIATNEKVSIVDINRVPVPLSYAVISEGLVIFCQNTLRLHSEEQRIWSLWSEYKYEHERSRYGL